MEREDVGIFRHREVFISNSGDSFAVPDRLELRMRVTICAVCVFSYPEP